MVIFISFVLMTKGGDDAGPDRVKDREAAAGGGEWGSRFCRTKKTKNDARSCARFAFGKIGGPFLGYVSTVLLRRPAPPPLGGAAFTAEGERGRLAGGLPLVRPASMVG
jgi:hypothetical protein